MGNKERMTYSDLNKLFKKHRSLANDLADRLKMLMLSVTSDGNLSSLPKYYQVDQSTSAQEVHQEGQCQCQEHIRKHKDLP